MKMKYLMEFYTCGNGNTGASQKQNLNDIRMDGHGAIISPALLLLLFWGQYWIQPEWCITQWQVSFRKRWLLLTPEFPTLPTEDPILLPGAKLMFLTCL